jgi:hypothetical protein
MTMPMRTIANPRALRVRIAAYWEEGAIWKTQVERGRRASLEPT